MKHSTSKASRLLTINEYLNTGKKINLKSLASDFNVSKRTIQRDLDDIKTFYADGIVRDGAYKDVYYDKDFCGYKLI